MWEGRSSKRHLSWKKKSIVEITLVDCGYLMESFSIGKILESGDRHDVSLCRVSAERVVRG